MHRVEAIVWDTRDKHSDEPSSTLGTFPDMVGALAAIAVYLSTENGPSIYKVEVLDIARS